MVRRKLTLLGLVVGVLCLVAPPGAWGQENITGSSVTAVNPITLTAGSTVTLCFTVNFISPDFEYMDHFDVDLPDGWTVGTVAANGADSERYRTVRDGRPLIARFQGSQVCDRSSVLCGWPYSRSAA